MQLRILNNILQDLGIARVHSMPQLPEKERWIKGNCKDVFPLTNCLFGCKKPISTRIYLQNTLTVLFNDGVWIFESTHPFTRLRDIATCRRFLTDKLPREFASKIDYIKPTPGTMRTSTFERYILPKQWPIDNWTWQGGPNKRMSSPLCSHIWQCLRPLLKMKYFCQILWPFKFCLFLFGSHEGWEGISRAHSSARWTVICTTVANRQWVTTG